MGRTRCRRSFILGLWPGRSVPGARRAYAARLVPGAGDRRDGVHHLACVQPGHRAVPDRRWGLPRRDQPDRPARRAGIRRCADRRLRAHDRDLGGKRRRCAVEPAAGIDDAVQAERRARAGRATARHEPARDEGVHPHPAADIRGVFRHPRGPDRLRNFRPRGRPHAGGSQRSGGDEAARARHRLGRGGVAVPARLFARRGYLHRHRGGVEQRADACASRSCAPAS